MKTAALIVIGDEILSGKVKDENSFVFGKTMFDRGVYLKRIHTIPDDIDTIAESVQSAAQNFDYVATSGGIGPTHDDLTYDGVAKGFALKLYVNPQAMSHLAKHKKNAGRESTLSEADMKMVTYPATSKVHFLEPLWLPLVVVNNVHIFPGVPYLFEKLIHGFSHFFSGDQFYRSIVYTDKFESSIAKDLKELQLSNPSIHIGSYPQMMPSPYRVMVVVEGSNDALVKEVGKNVMLLVDGRLTKEEK